MTPSDSLGPAIDESPEAEPPNSLANDIGKRVAAFRHQRKLTVSELAHRIGVSASLISQVEHGRARPSIGTLFALAEAMEMPVDAFFRDQRPASSSNAVRAPAASTGYAPAAAGSMGHLWKSDAATVDALVKRDRLVVHAGERATLEVENGVAWERLTLGPLEDTEFLEIIYAPHSESSPDLYRHPGNEMVLVLEGRLEIAIGFDSYLLEVGDSMHFPSSLPHRYANPSDERARAVTVMLRDHPTA